MSGRVVQFVVRFGYRFSSDFAGRHGTQKALKPFRFKGFWDFIGCLGVAKWRRGWDSNPRTSSSPVTRFRVERVTAASLPLRPAKDFSGS